MLSITLKLMVIGVCVTVQNLNNRFGDLSGFNSRNGSNFKYMYYNYHNRIRQRILNHELTGFRYVDKYGDISPCLLLFFSSEPKIRPIRPHRFIEYETLLNSIINQLNYTL
jgi:hypothetical protein